ncbi:MAG: hypothetical protein FWH55_13205, partial [Oscillospiraceae bacterium]|nr:hypothetical protein [Oscillospiraceae bacterium]
MATAAANLPSITERAVADMVEIIERATADLLTITQRAAVDLSKITERAAVDLSISAERVVDGLSAAIDGITGREITDDPSLVVVTPPVLIVPDSRWIPRELTPATYNTSHGPALAAYGNRLYMVYKGSNTDQRIWRTSFDGNNWLSSPTSFGSKFSASCGPALAVYDGKLYMAWTDSSDERSIKIASFNGYTWTDPVVTGANSSHGPALAVFDKKLYMAWKGNGNKGIWYATFNGNAQNTWVQKGNLNEYGVNTS